MYKVSFTLLYCKYCVSTLSYRVYKHFKDNKLFVKLIRHVFYFWSTRQHEKLDF